MATPPTPQTLLRRYAEPAESLKLKDVLDIAAHESAHALDAHEATIAALVEALAIIADERGHCGFCGKLAEGSGQGFVTCGRRECSWEPPDCQEIARAALAKAKETNNAR